MKDEHSSYKSTKTSESKAYTKTCRTINRGWLDKTDYNKRNLQVYQGILDAAKYNDRH